MYVRLLTNNFLSEKAVGKSESKDVHLAVLRVLPEVIRESVDADASSKSVIIYDPATGEKKMVSPTAVDGIESLGEVKTAEQTEAEINARMQDTIQRSKDWLEGNVANPVGMQIQLGDGRIATIEAMHEDGKSAIALSFWCQKTYCRGSSTTGSMRITKRGEMLRQANERQSKALRAHRRQPRKADSHCRRRLPLKRMSAESMHKETCLMSWWTGRRCTQR